MIQTEIGYTTPDTISVRGKNLATELLGHIDFVDMIIFVFYGRLPEPREKAMLNLLLVLTTDHGLTPSAVSARLTYLGAPEALQGAVAAGLLGAGSVFLGNAQNVAEMLHGGAASLDDASSDQEILLRARELVQDAKAKGVRIVGLGHNIHVDGDPRIPVLIAQSKAHGYFGKHWRLLLAMEHVINESRRKRLPINAGGGVGAIMAEMNLDPLLGRGVALIGRCAGLIAHVAEERDRPIGLELWDLILKQDPRNVLPE
jgi:citrate synthase